MTSNNLLPMKSLKIRILVMVFLAPAMLYAQWSADPSRNLTLFPGVDVSVWYRGVGTIQGCKDGSVYTTFFDRDTLLHVRRLDKDGFDIWPPNLVTFRVAGFPYGGSFIDAHDNLYINFDRQQPAINGYEFILLKVDKDGRKLFGENGILFQNPNRNDNMYNARYSVNDQEDVFFSYFRTLGDTSCRIIHRITRNGNLPWGEEGLVLPEHITPEMIVCEDNGFFLLVNKYIGVHHDDFRYEVYVRKYDLLGNRVWGRDIMVYKGYRPEWTIDFFKGSAGDFYMGWEPSWIQHIQADGSYEWCGSGIDLISDSTAWSAAPQFAGLNSKGELMIYFCRFDNHYKNPRLFGQLIDQQGQRLWGDTGRPILIEDFSGQYASMNNQYILRMNNDTAYLFYRYPLPAYPSHPYSLRAMAIDGEGKAVWPKSIEVATERPNIYMPTVTDFVDNQAILLWSETSSTKKGILKAQNFRTDGTLGIKSGSSPNEPITRKIPYNYNPDTHTVRFTELPGADRYTLHNSSGQSLCAGQAAQEIRLPDLPGGIYVLCLLKDSRVIDSFKIFIR